MKIIAWICFILAALRLFVQVGQALIKEKTSSDRVAGFLGSLVNLFPVYFFYVYLLKGGKSWTMI